MVRVKLTREERADLFAGRCPTLYRDEEPEYEKGAVYVLSWSRASRYSDEEGRVFSPPPQPLFWIRVTTIKRRTDGRWAVSYDVVDRRDPTNWMRRTPPTHAVEADQPALDKEEEKRAREVSSYTTTRRGALDPVSTLSTDTVDQLTAKVREGELREYESRRARVQEALDDLKAATVTQHHSARLRYVERKLGELDRKVRLRG